MQDSNYTPRLSAEELAEMNRQPLPEPMPDPEPTAVALPTEDWNSLVRAVNRIAKAKYSLEDGMQEMKQTIQTTVKEATDKALEEQRKLTQSKIHWIVSSAEEQVGRAAAEACRRIRRRTYRDDALWWMKIVFYGLIILLEILRCVQ